MIVSLKSHQNDKIYRNITSFYLKKDFNLIKKGNISSKTFYIAHYITHAVIFAWHIWIICTITTAFMYLFMLRIFLHSWFIDKKWRRNRNNSLILYVFINRLTINRISFRKQHVLFSVDLLFVQFIFVQHLFIQSYPNLT